MRWEDIRREWFADPEFRRAFEEEYPYHDLSLEIGGLRADMDLTQTEFAQLVGMPQSTVARLESGRHNPSVRVLKQLARATGTELVIEFRPTKRKRRPRSGSVAASSGRGSSREPMAASSTRE